MVGGWASLALYMFSIQLLSHGTSAPRSVIRQIRNIYRCHHHHIHISPLLLKRGHLIHTMCSMLVGQKPLSIFREFRPHLYRVLISRPHHSAHYPTPCPPVTLDLSIIGTDQSCRPTPWDPIVFKKKLHILINPEVIAPPAGTVHLSCHFLEWKLGA